MTNRNILLFTTVALALATTFTSCKQCYNCSNVCYECQQAPDPFCRNMFSTQQQFDALIANIEASGYDCNITTSTISEDFCDDTKSATALRESYENQGLTCTEK